MSDSDENLPLSPNDAQATENRMRRALGLQGPSRQPPQQRADQVRPRHRFVQDGGVPVVVLNSRNDHDPTAVFKARVAELEAALEAERTAHGAPAVRCMRRKRPPRRSRHGLRTLNSRTARFWLWSATLVRQRKKACKPAWPCPGSRLPGRLQSCRKWCPRSRSVRHRKCLAFRASPRPRIRNRSSGGFRAFERNCAPSCWTPAPGGTVKPGRRGLWRPYFRS